MRRRVILALIVVVFGCTFEDGKGFATLDASLSASWETPADRDVGDGWVALNNSYEVRLEEVRLVTSDLSLRGSMSSESGSGESSGGTFDPANPPAGYTLCHNGHCHADDGSLVSNEDIQSELNGGGSTSGLSTIASLPVGEIDLIAGFDSALDCESSCELPQSSVSEVALELLTLTLTGVVRDGSGQGRVADGTSWSLDVDFAAGDAVTAEVDLPIDRDKRPNIDMAVSLTLDVTLLDDLDWAGAGEGAIDLSQLPSPEHEGETVAEHAGEKVLEHTLVVGVERSHD